MWFDDGCSFLAGAHDWMRNDDYVNADNWFLCMVGKRYGDRSTYRGEVGGLARMVARKRGEDRLGHLHIERTKGVRWMPWHQEAMKDVARCEKPWGAASRL